MSHQVWLDCRASNSCCMAAFQLGSRKADRAEVGIGETVGVTAVMAYHGFGLWMLALARVTMGCRRVAASGGGVAVVDEVVLVEEEEEVGEVSNWEPDDDAGDAAMGDVLDRRRVVLIESRRRALTRCRRRGARRSTRWGALLGGGAMPGPAAVCGGTMVSMSLMIMVDGSCD